MSSTASGEACQVCGESSAGWHCGTITCEACKKFFLRKLKEGILGIKCVRNTNACIITKATRTNCQYCRFQRCLHVGMKSPDQDREQKQQPLDYSGIFCKVCNQEASGVHFGVITCEGCKGFFRRQINEGESTRLVCESGGNCPIKNQNRNSCRACRFNECLKVGMDLTKIKIGRQSNLFKKRLREVASNAVATRLTSPPNVPLVQVVVSPPVVTSLAISSVKVEDNLNIRSRDLVKEILQAHEESMAANSYEIYNPNPIQYAYQIIENNFKLCKRFLEGIKFYKELYEPERKIVLTASLHALRFVDVITRSISASGNASTDNNSSTSNNNNSSNNSEVNYFECDAERARAIATHLPAFAKLDAELAMLCEKMRALKLDAYELVIYKAFLAFALAFACHQGGMLKCERSLVSVDKLKLYEFKLSRALKEYMHFRRNELESSVALLMHKESIARLQHALQAGLETDLNDLRNNGYVDNYNFLSTYFF